MRHTQVFVGALALLIAIAAGLGGLSRDVLDVGTWPALQEERDREPEVTRTTRARRRLPGSAASAAVTAWRVRAAAPPARATPGPPRAATPGA